MTILQLDAALNRYETALTALKQADGKPSEDVILGVLIARDAVQAVLADITEIPQEKLLVVIQLDKLTRI